MNGMSLAPLSLVSLESVDFQIKDPIGRDLSILVEDFRATRNEKGTLSEKEQKEFLKLFESRLRKRFKLDELVFLVEEYEGADAFALTPDIAANNVLARSYGAWWTTGSEGAKMIDKYANKSIGWVDRSSATVGGVFQKAECTVAVTTGLIFSSNYTPDEVAAVILHEIGHIFTYFEMIAYTFSTCFILMDTVNRLTKANSPEEKTKIVKSLKDSANIVISNPDEVTEMSSDTQTVSIFSDIISQTKSQFGSTIYDKRSWESLADQFSARMGMIVPLASIVDKFNREGDPSSYQSSFIAWIPQLLKLIGVVFTIIVLPWFGFSLLFLGAILMLFNPFDRVYDKPNERITRIRNELVSLMKNPKTPVEERKRLHNDLIFIDGILKETVDRETLTEKVWLFLSADARDQKKKRELLQDLESISNNNLFASVNLLKSLK